MFLKLHAAIASVILLVAAAPLPVWLEVGSATDGTRAFVDTSSLQEAEAVVTVRQKFILPRPAPKTLSRVDQLAAYSCRTRTVTALQSKEFDQRGLLLRQSLQAERPTRISRGSLPEVIFDLVC